MGLHDEYLNSHAASDKTIVYLNNDIMLKKKISSVEIKTSNRSKLDSTTRKETNRREVVDIFIDGKLLKSFIFKVS